MSSVIESRELSKRFLLRHNRSGSIKERFLGAIHTSHRERTEEFWALRDVTLSIKSGEAVGIIGRNGSGKSTFLRLVAGIHRPTEGWLGVRRGSRIGTMIELGIGFHPELTGTENLFLSASVHGLTRNQIEGLYERIVAYAGLAAFMDVAMKNYSSGMTVRLAFALAANLDPDMLLLDEVFAVGDVAFQQQCIQTMQQFRADGKTILFVSHSAPAIRSICDRVCLLDHGRLLFDGPVARGLQEYERVTASNAAAPAQLESSQEHDGGWHRVVPGGKWSEGGEWAFELLRREGLQPSDVVLDVGCGGLSTGRHLLKFLDELHYWGFDTNHALVLAGVTLELPRLGVSANRGSFLFNQEFDLSSSPEGLRFAISEGFFSRLPLNRIARCIASVTRRLAPGGRFYATWLENPDPRGFDPIDRGSFTTFPDAEPYHYPFAMLASICDAMGARAERVATDPAHPRGESLMIITPGR
ncbi:MAG: ATP-binding cassette domain-containing protein [Vicinamibacterales bacterium]|nr:ATP-binding cassette domain-containing protein [Vicinamibacterales bacterium]